MNEFWATLAVQGAGICVLIGINLAATRRNTEDIKGLKQASEKHDGEIGYLYGTAKLTR